MEYKVIRNIEEVNLSKFVNVAITGDSYRHDLGNNHLRCSMNIELFYLHPNRFRPDKNIYNLLNINKDEKFTLIRFVSWDAHHDTGLSGLSLENKIKSGELSEILALAGKNKEKTPVREKKSPKGVSRQTKTPSQRRKSK